MTSDLVMTMAADDAEDAPPVGTLAAAHGAYLRDRMRCSEFYNVKDLAVILPLVVAYGLMQGRLPGGLGEGDAEAMVMRAGAIICHASWRDCQQNAHVSTGGRLVIAVPRVYTQGQPGSTFAVPNPSSFTKRRVIRFAQWSVGLLAPVHERAWMRAAVDVGDPVAGAALAILANGRASGAAHA